MLVEEELTGKIIGSAIEVHRELGPGLLESAYHQCLCHELTLRGLKFQREIHLPVKYKQVRLDCGYQADIIVEQKVILELKCVAEISAIHEAQILTYLKLANLKIGILLNFNVASLRDGIKRFVL